MDMIEVLSHPLTTTTVLEDENNFFHARFELHGRFFVLISGLDQAGGDYTSFWEEDEEGNEFVNNDCPTCGGPGYFGICAKCD